MTKAGKPSVRIAQIYTRPAALPSTASIAKRRIGAIPF
jgi:hypothetical protein